MAVFAPDGRRKLIRVVASTTAKDALAVGALWGDVLFFEGITMCVGACSGGVDAVRRRRLLLGRMQ
jgi:hypothetical protein